LERGKATVKILGELYKFLITFIIVITILGWGKLWASSDDSSDQFADKLLDAHVQLKSHQDCKTVYDERLLTSNMLCAGEYNNLADTCSGDSGGPLMCENRDGSW